MANSSSDQGGTMEGLVTGWQTNSSNCFSLFLDSFPPGYRFMPTDEELVLYYLLPKIKNLMLPPHPIKDVNLYGHNPDYFAERYNDSGLKQWYFFTQREKKYPYGGRPNRVAGDGYWRPASGEKPITSPNKTRIGSKKSFVFYEGMPPDGTKTLWLMQQYTIDGALRPTNQSMRIDDWVLCKIYKRPADPILTHVRSPEPICFETSNLKID